MILQHFEKFLKARSFQNKLLPFGNEICVRSSNLEQVFQNLV